MEVVAVATAAVGVVKLIQDVGSGVVSLRSTVHGIQGIDAVVAGFQGELDALQYALTVLSTEVESSKGTLPATVAKWWRTASLENILESAVKTLDRLQVVFGEIRKDRRMLGKARRYYASRQYEEEIRHLRNCIGTYISCLNLPVILIANVRQPSLSPELRTDFRFDLLGSKLAALDANISELKESFLRCRKNATNKTPISQPRSQTISSNEACRLPDFGSTMEEAPIIIHLAASISVGVRTVATRLSSRNSMASSTPSSARGGVATNAIDTGQIDDDLASLVNMVFPERPDSRVLSWVHGTGLSPEHTGVPFSIPQTPYPPSESLDLFSMARSLTSQRVTTYSAAFPSPRTMTPQQEFFSYKLRRAKELINEKDMVQAIHMLQHLVEAIPNNPDVELGRDVYPLYARALAGSRLHPDSIDQILKQNPQVDREMLDPSMEQAQILMSSDRYEEAVPHIIRSQESERRQGLPDNTYLDVCLARCLLEELIAPETLTEKAMRRVEQEIKAILEPCCAKDLSEPSDEDMMEEEKLHSSAHLILAATNAWMRCYDKANEHGEKAVDRFHKLTGRDSADTRGAIALMARVSELRRHEDAQFWREMLPNDTTIMSLLGPVQTTVVLPDKRLIKDLLGPRRRVFRPIYDT
ncbi:hypothetical protein B0H63DRAFT_527499 [Podospora didyma]|uniref:Fungal N-terminal domain-containing protein n=1 Tax=Podospora didyma TaxID=330526 RepID=A0AAE0N6K3_9PEZI|nr:hypothetical protein B0H63DRAFT_527499 [Podospora didyma]